MHGRFPMHGQSSAPRKSRLEGGRQSFLPKPRHAGSIDRLSAEIRRPSVCSGPRSSSAEPPRATIGGGRLSRETSASKLTLHAKSRSQQAEQSRYGPSSSMTPLCAKKYSSSRATTTPQRTPSEDRLNRNWQTSLDRALAFVTVKDHRPLSNASWQRDERNRVQEALAARGDCGGGGGGGSALIRPLTIARFVDITGALINRLLREVKLTNDNYVTKVPHLAKLLLYPGVVSKSWLKTVNTLHAFPHALAFIAYLLDLLQRVELPVQDDWLYVDNDELAVLRRDYLVKCWIRFQEPNHQFDDLNEEHLRNLRSLLGNDDEKIAGLEETIKAYKMVLEDPEEQAARADFTRRVETRDSTLASLRRERAARMETKARRDTLEAKYKELKGNLHDIDAEIEKANTESAALRRELESQPMSVPERTKLLDEVDYSLRVQDSKRALAEQITKTLFNKEVDLASWQKNTLDSCVQYKHALIHLSASFPHLAQLAVDENDLMGPGCLVAVSSAVDALKQQVASLNEQLSKAERTKNAQKRHQTQKVEDTRVKLNEMKLALQREREALAAEQATEATEQANWTSCEQQLTDQIQALRVKQQQTCGVLEELGVYEQQEQFWCKNLGELNEYVKTTKAQAQTTLQEAKHKRMKIVLAAIRKWEDTLDEVTNH